ncbi:MAG: ATP-binding protein [Oligoflexus sp.]
MSGQQFQQSKDQSDSHRPKLVDRFIPDEYLQGDFERRRRARLLIIFASSLVVFGVFYALLYTFRYRVPSIAIMLAVGTSFTATIPLVLRFTKSFVLASTQLLCTYYSVLMIANITAGGIDSASIFWLSSVPIIAMILQETKQGMLWLGVCLLSGTSNYYTNNYGFTSLIPEDKRPQAKFFGFVGLMILIPLLVRLYEIAKNRMLAEIETAKKETERLRLVAEEAHKNARLVLDSVAQGLIIVNFDGTMRGEYSRSLSDWFGHPDENQLFWEYLRQTDENFANWVEISWMQLNQSVLPAEIALKQVPKQLQTPEQRYLEFDIKLVDSGQGTQAKFVMVVVSDITDRINAEIAEESRKEMLAIIENLAKNRHFTNEILHEIEVIIANLIARQQPLSAERQLLHTLKGSTAIAGLTSFSRLCHQMENHSFESRTRLTRDDLNLLQAKWETLQEKIKPFLLFYDRENYLLKQSDFQFIVESIAHDAPKYKILEFLDNLKKEPISERFMMLADHAKDIARRVGKEDIQINIEDHDIRLEEEHWSSFWSSFIHAVRNAIDHGIELPAERQKNGKVGPGLITFRSRYVGPHLVISIADDGRGINWDKIRRKAKQKNLPHQTVSELTDLLFMDGFTILDETTELSGRGVGMGALKQVCQTMGGVIEIHSEANVGTTIDFIFPKQKSSVHAA